MPLLEKWVHVCSDISFGDDHYLSKATTLTNPVRCVYVYDQRKTRTVYFQVVRHVACGNRHSAAVTIEGDLYTWGEGDHGRLGEYMYIRRILYMSITTIGYISRIVMCL